MKLFFIRFIFAFLGLCGLVFAFEFAKSFSTLLLANNISVFFFTSLLFTLTSLAASMVAFHAMRKTPSLKAKQRLAYGLAFFFMILPSVMINFAMNKIMQEQETLKEVAIPKESIKTPTPIN